MTKRNQKKLLKTCRKYRDPLLLLAFCVVYVVGAITAKFPEWQRVWAAPLSPVPQNVVEVIKEVPVEIFRQPKTLDEMFLWVFGYDAEDAKKISKCESGMNPKAHNKNTNGSIDTGLMQINSVHGISERYLQDPLINLLVAKRIYDRQGWGPWVCSRKVGL